MKTDAERKLLKEIERWEEGRETEGTDGKRDCPKKKYTKEKNGKIGTETARNEAQKERKKVKETNTKGTWNAGGSGGRRGSTGNPKRKEKGEKTKNL